jgi:SAM-dependent methyltransferase
MNRAAAPAGLLGGCVREGTGAGAPTAAGAACRWCRAERLDEVRRRGTHRVLRCRACDFLTLETGLDEARLGESYQDYLPTDPAEIARWEREQRPVVRRALDAIRRLRPHARDLLEIGSGFGFFLAAARAAGLAVEGAEFSANGRRHSRERFELAVHDVPVEQLPFAPASFDVVAAFYVVEHLADPRPFLLAIHRLLRPGGLVFLRWPHTTPLARALDLLRVGHDLYHAPWHLSDFTPATMERALRQTGFDAVRTRTFGGTAAGGPAGTLLSRGAAALSDALELASGARLHLPGVSKTSYGTKR